MIPLDTPTPTGTHALALLQAREVTLSVLGTARGAKSTAWNDRCQANWRARVWSLCLSSLLENGEKKRSSNYALLEEAKAQHGEASLENSDDSQA